MDELLLDYYSNGILELSPSRRKNNFLQSLIKGLSSGRLSFNFQRYVACKCAA